MKPPLPNSYWVEPGRLLAGEYPGRADDPSTPERLQRLLDAGIDSFIDLTAPAEGPSYRTLLHEGLHHHARPLPDHAVPRSLADMVGIQRLLQAELDAGRHVYVHCRAGIGRTGLVIGCYLRDRGRSPAAALQELNRLWQQNARSRRWPVTPETPEQEAFVLAWPGSSRVPDDAPAPLLRQRFRGCLLGLAAGDALNARPLPPGTWTDDTAMTLCVLTSLAATGHVDAHDQVRQYEAWIHAGERSATGTALGLRPGVRDAIARAGWRRGSFAGNHDPLCLDPEPLARCAAPALHFHGDLGAAIDAGADCARVTHQAPLLVDACRLFTAMLHEALSGADRQAILRVRDRWPGPPLREEIQVLADGWAADDAPVAGPDAPPRGILRCLDRVARTFREVGAVQPGLEQLAGRGADRDVSGAAYGALAGAHEGEGGIPGDWRGSLARLDDLVAVADQLSARGVPGSPR